MAMPGANHSLATRSRLCGMLKVARRGSCGLHHQYPSNPSATVLAAVPIRLLYNRTRSNPLSYRMVVARRMLSPKPGKFVSSILTGLRPRLPCRWRCTCPPRRPVTFVLPPQRPSTAQPHPPLLAALIFCHLLPCSIRQEHPRIMPACSRSREAEIGTIAFYFICNPPPTYPQIAARAASQRLCRLHLGLPISFSE